MNNWQIVGILLILVGVTILALLSGFVVTIIVTLAKLVAVFAGILLIIVGAALLIGRHWMRPRGWRWGPPTSST